MFGMFGEIANVLSKTSEERNQDAMVESMQHDPNIVSIKRDGNGRVIRVVYRDGTVVGDD
jgi:PBP1b-binding outer membrane lipoprotein LpoB